MTHRPPTQNDLPQDEPEFPSQDLALFVRLRAIIEQETAHHAPQDAHRVWLGAASELIDAASELSASHRPGVRAVELSLLAARINELAHTFRVTK